MENSLSKLENSNDKLQKPDFAKKTGRELLAFYLKTKFKKIVAYDKKAPKPLFLDIKDDFLDVFLKRLILEPQKRILVAITGESASGKTTICNEIKRCIEDFSLPVSILNADNYFNDISDLISKYGTFDALRDNGYDVDSPESFQLDLLKRDLIELSIGHDIKSPEYLINGTGVSVANSIPVRANKIIVVEGMASLYKDLSDVFDIKIYIDIEENLRKDRFMERASIRNQNHENAQKHWEYLNHTGDNYIKPLKNKCEIIASGECDLTYFRDILEYLKFITNNFAPPA